MLCLNKRCMENSRERDLFLVGAISEHLDSILDMQNATASKAYAYTEGQANKQRQVHLNVETCVCLLSQQTGTRVLQWEEGSGLIKLAQVTIS